MKSTESFEQEISRSLGEECGVDLRSQRIGVALSGGADSVALLAALCALGADCVALHCNFNLRGEESRGDEAFCRQLARQLDCRLEVVEFDTEGARQAGESTEMVCRRLRYDWFETVSRKLRLDCIAIAHHREDAVETVFLNFLRGTGPKGLSGMSSRRGVFVRPMLGLSRSRIEDYLNERGLTFRIDSSNLSNDYRRNALRNDILPLLGRYFPDYMAGVNVTMNVMKSTDAMLSDFVKWTAQRFVGSDGGIDVAALKASVSDPAGTLYLLLRSLFSDGCSVTTVASILASNETGSRFFETIDGSGLELKRGVLRPVPSGSDARSYPVCLDGDVSLPVGIRVEIISRDEFLGDDKTPETAYFDAAILDEGHQFSLRHWRHGDRLNPFGMKGCSRKLSDIFSDMKLTVAEKNSQWLLTCDDEIIWIVGVRAASFAPVGPITDRVLRLRVSKR